MPSVQATHAVALAPAPALELWADPARWPAFVDGFGHLERLDEAWPAPGAELVWRSVPEGRGLVTERVTDHAPGERLVTRVADEALTGTQSVLVAAAPEGGRLRARVRLELDYELTGWRGPLGRLAAALFVRRPLREAQERTLRRFAVEAEEEAAP